MSWRCASPAATYCTGAGGITGWAQNHALAFAAGLANSLELPVLYLESLTCDYPYASGPFAHLRAPGDAGKRRASLAKTRDRLRLPRSPSQGADGAAIQSARSTRGGSGHRRLPAARAAVRDRCLRGGFLRRGAWPTDSRPLLRRLLHPPQDSQAAAAISENSARHEGESPVGGARRRGWHTEVTADTVEQLVAKCEIDHSVAMPRGIRGGRAEGKRRLKDFLQDRLRRYSGEKNDPARHATSELSPYLHRGTSLVSRSSVGRAGLRSGE